MTSEVNPSWLRFELAYRDKIARSTVSFVGWHDDRMIQNGSGVLFQIAGNHFVFTAAHVVRVSTVTQNQIPYFLAPSRSDSPAIPLHNAKASMTHGDDTDKIDIAAVEIGDDVVSQLLPERQFIHLADLDLSCRPVDGVYELMGFPNEYCLDDSSSRTVKINPMRLITSVFQGERSPSHDPQYHLLLEYAETFADVDGVQIHSPSPRGMSGGGIWRIADDAFASDNDSTLKLVATENSWDKGRRDHVKGTWIVWTIKLIWDHYPALRPAMRINWPNSLPIR